MLAERAPIQGVVGVVRRGWNKHNVVLSIAVGMVNCKLCLFIDELYSSRDKFGIGEGRRRDDIRGGHCRLLSGVEGWSQTRA